MAFWGTEIKPGKPYTHTFESEHGRLHLSQATLGNGSSNKKCIVQCNVGDKKPIYLASLLPERLETCPLNIEFEEDEKVMFSVIGSHSIHLSGFFYGESDGKLGHDYESGSDGEDIADSDTEDADADSSDYDSENEYDYEFIDDDLVMYPPSPVPNSGVKIEEIVVDKKPAADNGTSKQGKKKRSQSNVSDENDDSRMQVVVKSRKGGPVLEDEDEDGFPISFSGVNGNGDCLDSDENLKSNDKKVSKEAKTGKENDKSDSIKSLKRKIGVLVQDNKKASAEAVSEVSSKKKKKNKKKKASTKEEEAQEANPPDAMTTEDIDGSLPVVDDKGNKLTNSESPVVEEKPPTGKEKMKNKKKNKKLDTAASGNMEQDEKNEEPFQVRTFPNGLVIEELKMGRPDGKKASPGKKVSVHYIGKLKKNGKIFDSNIGRAPFKFRLGIGQVIKGWDVGVGGMRVGDKRRLTIPPAMGYGAKGAGTAIPPNSWLVFDVELVDVN